MRNIEELTYKIDKINDKIINNVVKAQRESAEEVLGDVKELCKQYGWHKYPDSIKIEETIVNRNGISTPIYTDIKLVSKRDGDEYNLGYLLETGTSPHLIVPIDAKYLHFKIDGKDIFTKMVYHTGTVAQPHFKPALNMNKLTYKMKLGEAIRRSLDG